MRIPKWLKVVGGILIALWLLGKFAIMPMMQKETKKISKEVTTSFNEDGYDLSVTYSSPAKKGRTIFGELVPYGVVWRTGANEPTTFTTKSAIKIIDKELPMGTYSLWTIPGRETWNVIFNQEVPEWGVTLLGGESSRNAEADAINVTVPAIKRTVIQENFTIEFKNNGQLFLVLSWDDTEVSVPINP